MTAAGLGTVGNDAMARLFDVLKLRGLALRNRIMFSPMSQNSADRDGKVTTWHVVHYGSRAVGGAGLIMLEDTAVEPRGRLGPSALGMYDDAQADALEELVTFCQEQGAAVGIQLGHAGRKAYGATKGQADTMPLGPTDEPFDAGWAEPAAASEQDLDGVIEAYRAAARRCARIGVDTVEIHAAHGYLLHSFLSPLSNTRVDAYGGSTAGRQRLLFRVLAAVRQEWPEDRALCVRLSAADEASGGLEPEDMLEMVAALRQQGVDLLAASSGGLVPGQMASNPPPRQVSYASDLRQCGMATVALGGVSTPTQADEIIRGEAADMVGIGRPLLLDPYWPLRAAEALAANADWPRQYRAAVPVKT